MSDTDAGAKNALRAGTREPQEVELATPQEFYETFQRVRQEIARVVVGQDRVIEHLLVAVFSDGHVLLSGAPGLGRTLIVKTLAEILGLEYRRLQFTPDLLPTDIIGTEILENRKGTGDRAFRFFKGPVFANMVLADEINRSPVRTQAALLEVMQERQVSIGGQTYFLPRPYNLVATLNTLESDGTWQLGEAQTDRFMFAIEQEYPSYDEENTMLRYTTGSFRSQADKVTGPEQILKMQALAKRVPVVPSVRDFALALVRASRPESIESVESAKRTVRLGASPRAAQALLRGGKVSALARGRTHVTREDIINVARPALAHRLLLDFRAEAEGRTYSDVLDDLVARAEEKALPTVSKWTRELLKVSEGESK